MKKNQPNRFSYMRNKNKLKNIKSLNNKQGKILTTDSEILQECKNYFQNLYTKQNTCEKTQNLLLKQITNEITNAQNNQLTKQIETSEIKEAIQSMENGKSPGITIKKDLQKIFNEILFTKKKTPKSSNQAIITFDTKKR